MKKLCLLFLILVSHLSLASVTLVPGLKILDLGVNSLVIEYQTLPTIIPAQSGHWIGLWKGIVYPSNLNHLKDKVIAVRQVNLDQSHSTLGMNNLLFERNTDYTLIYFNSADVSSPAALIHFNASEIQY